MTYFGPVSFDRKIFATLNNELPSVSKLFQVLTHYGFTRPVPVRQEDGTYQFWDPGSSIWGLRGLSKAAKLSIHTVRYGLHRLTKLGLIRRVSNKLGTIVQVLGFFRLRKQNPQVGVNAPFSKAPDPSFMTQVGDTRVAENDPYNRDLKIFNRSLTSSVDVPPPAGLKILEREETTPSRASLEYILGALSPARRAKIQL